MSNTHTTSDEGKANGEAKTGAESRPTALPINVLAQYLKDLSFENPRAPDSLMQGQTSPEVIVNVNININNIKEGIDEVTLTLRVEAKTGSDIAFLADVSYAGLFSLPGLPQEHHKAVLLIEAPRLLFPFVRAIISENTRNGGFPPLLINPIDFAELYRRQLTQNA
ncbi:MAG: protein-export chaperone SecB [Rhodospirillaceae bacterium]